MIFSNPPSHGTNLIFNLIATEMLSRKQNGVFEGKLGPNYADKMVLICSKLYRNFIIKKNHRNLANLDMLEITQLPLVYGLCWSRYNARSDWPIVGLGLTFSRKDIIINHLLIV